MGLIDTMNEKLNKVTEFVFSLVTKDMLQQEAYLVIDGLNDCLYQLDILDNPIDSAIIGQVLKEDPQYMKFYRKLHGHIGVEESKRPLTAIRKLCTLYILELEYMLKHVEPNKSNKDKSIKNTTLSQLSHMGFVESGIDVERFAKAFLFKAWCCYIDFSSQGPNPKLAIKSFKQKFPYFVKLVDEKTDAMADIANRYCSPLREPTIFKKMQSFFKGEAYDPVLFTEDNKPNTDYLAIMEDSPEVSTYAIFGLPSLNLFRHGANIYLNWRHARVQRKEYEKRCLENYVIALQMKKREMNSNDAEYKKIEKVISAYEEMISDLTADIDHYRNS